MVTHILEKINWRFWKKEPPKMCKECGENPVSHPAQWYCDSCNEKHAHVAWLDRHHAKIARQLELREKRKTEAAFRKKNEEFLDLAIRCMKEHLGE